LALSVEQGLNPGTWSLRLPHDVRRLRGGSFELSQSDLHSPS
jgi:hypothetical protein